jgi:hypothetical protein
LGRRLWLILLPALIAVAAAYAYSNTRAQKHYAAVSRVQIALSATSSSVAGTNPGEARALAASYVAALRVDRGFFGFVASQSGVPEQDVHQRLTVARVSHSPVIRISFASENQREVQAVIGAARRAVTGGAVGANVIAPQSLTAVSGSESIVTATGVGYRGTLAVQVPLSITSSAPPNPAGAQELATAYAASLSSTTQLQRAVGAKLDAARDAVQISVQAPSNTNLLNITVRTSTRASAVSCARLAARMLMNGTSRVAGISPSALELVSDPSSATSSGGATPLSTTLPIAIILGLALGVMAAAASLQLDARVEDPTSLATLVGAPCTPMDELRASPMHDLPFWPARTDDAVAPPVDVTLVPTDEASRLGAEAFVAHLPGTKQRAIVAVISAGAVPGPARTPSLSVTVIVARRDTDRRSVRDAVTQLHDAGRRADWSLFA